MFVISSTVSQAAPLAPAMISPYQRPPFQETRLMGTRYKIENATSGPVTQSVTAPKVSSTKAMTPR